MEYFVPVLIAILYGQFEGFSLEIPIDNDKTDLFYYTSEDPDVQLQLYCMNNEGSYIYSMSASVGSENMNEGNPSRPIRKAVFDNFIENSPRDCMRESVSVRSYTFGCNITETTDYSKSFKYKVISEEDELNIWDSNEQSCFKDNMTVGGNIKDIFQTCDDDSPNIGTMYAQTRTSTSRWNYGGKDEEGKTCMCGEAVSCDSFEGTPAPSAGWDILSGALWDRYGDDAIDWARNVLQ